MLSDLFHVTSALNRESIGRFGLDWTRMRAASGIAGSARPELDGVFLCRGNWEADFFVRMNNTGGPVDVWSVADVDDDELLESDNGFAYVAAVIPSGRLTIVETDATRPEWPMDS